jgi:hypothetical protein
VSLRYLDGVPLPKGHLPFNDTLTVPAANPCLVIGYRIASCGAGTTLGDALQRWRGGALGPIATYFAYTSLTPGVVACFARECGPSACSGVSPSHMWLAPGSYNAASGKVFDEGESYSTSAVTLAVSRSTPVFVDGSSTASISVTPSVSSSVSITPSVSATPTTICAPSSYLVMENTALSGKGASVRVLPQLFASICLPSTASLARCCPVHVCTCHPCAAYVPTAGLVDGAFAVSAWVRVDSVTPVNRVLLHVSGAGVELVMWYVHPMSTVL